MTKREIIIVDYDPRLPIFYEEEKRRILEAIGHKVIAIEHIGSTAVHGLGGKPIIDIMAGVCQSTDADECIPPLQDLGYTNVTPPPEEPDWHYCLSKAYQGGSVKLKNYHLHLVNFTSDHWQEHLLFRDFLRTHPEVAQQYYRLKKELASKFGSDREAYTEAKTPFIESTIAEAKRSRKKSSRYEL